MQKAGHVYRQYFKPLVICDTSSQPPQSYYWLLLGRKYPEIALDECIHLLSAICTEYRFIYFNLKAKCKWARRRPFDRVGHRNRFGPCGIRSHYCTVCSLAVDPTYLHRGFGREEVEWGPAARKRLPWESQHPRLVTVHMNGSSLVFSMQETSSQL